MSIDLEALKRACEGDPDSKIAVRREWLQEVYRALTERETLGKVDDFVGRLGEKLYGMGGRR